MKTADILPAAGKRHEPASVSMTSGESVASLLNKLAGPPPPEDTTTLAS